MSKIKDIRNVSLISHGGAGKTTLTEAILHNAGQIGNLGNIEEGNTHSDFLKEEQEHLYSINNSYFTFPWQDKQINLIDTPGYADFRGEVASALRMVESAVLLINATAGIEVNTDFVWSMVGDNNLSRFIFINKSEKDDADFNNLMDELEESFEENLVPLVVPYKEGDEYQGVIDLLNEKLIRLSEDGESKEDLPAEAADMVDDLRFNLIEEIVELDDELMMKYLEDEEITSDELIKALVEGVGDHKLVPVMAGSALKNSGVNLLLDYLAQLGPDPTRVDINQFTEEEVEIEPAPDNPILGMVGKTMVDPYIGKLSIFRIFSDELTRGKEVYIPRINDTLDVSKLYKINGSEQENVDKLTTGEIGAVAKMDELETSDTFCDPDLDAVFKEIDFPEPMLTLAAWPLTEAEDEKMSSAINRYSHEDPTFKVDYDRETKELLVSGMGSVHLSVIKDICERKFDVSFKTTEPSVAYRETIQKKVDVEEKYKKQSGGRGQYGHVMLRIEPLKRGEGFEFDEEIFGGAIPSQYIPAVGKGIEEAKEEGVLANYPVVDFKATVYDGSYHDVDSSEMAFKIAGSKAFRQGVEKAKPVLLEPIMDVRVIVPERFMGDIMGDLNSRRGKIMGMDPSNGIQIIKARVPQGEMFSYANDLKSLTGGRGKFEMEFSHYDKVPSDLQQEIIEKAAREED
ncbi:MAG: elongation factor G [Bacillota bacterium]